MFFIDADRLDYTAINEALRRSGPVCRITGCLGQRFIAAGMSDKTIEIYGIPGNALGAYLTGAEITVNGNAQDAVGDTMNAGRIVVRGDSILQLARNLCGTESRASCKSFQYLRLG